MNKKDLALGAQKVTINSAKKSTQTTEEKIAFLSSKVETIEDIIAYIYKKIEKENNLIITHTDIGVIALENKTKASDKETNKDGIPVNTVLVGVTYGKPYVLTVNRYDYSIGDKIYETLSAAAEAVSGNRRSGWVFWKTFDGRTAKEAFNKE